MGSWALETAQAPTRVSLIPPPMAVDFTQSRLQKGSRSVSDRLSDASPRQKLAGLRTNTSPSSPDKRGPQPAGDQAPTGTREPSHTDKQVNKSVFAPILENTEI